MTSPKVRHLLDIASVLVLLIVVPAYLLCRLGLVLLIAVPTAYIFCRLQKATSDWKSRIACRGS